MGTLAPRRGDPYATESAVELDQSLFLRWKTAKDNADAWAREANRLRAELEEQLGDAHAGTIDGAKVITYRPVAKWAESRLVNDYPDLTERYWMTEERPVFNLGAFRAAHPEVAERYQSRSFCLVAQ